MASKRVHGVIAAVLTPRGVEGSLDEAGFSRLLEFLLKHGVRGFAINGATGEFPLTTPAELETQLRHVRKLAGPDAQMLCGVGAASLAHSLKLAEVAETCGATALLLPAPFYFTYEQQDLAAWAAAISSSTKVPALLYNLPQFASGFNGETVSALLQSEPGIVGIKDSSGSLDILTALSDSAVRIVGNDSVLAAAMEARVCDGVVSGVACVLPEVIQSLWAATPGSPEFVAFSSLLKEFTDQLGFFPTPWGLKWIGEARELFTARFAQAVAAERQTQAQGLQEWFREWLPSSFSGSVLG